MACTRRAARATRSLTTVSPQSASWCPVARTTWSGTSRSTTMPRSASSAGCPASRSAAGGAAGARQPSSCQRTRSATAVADSIPSCRQSLRFSRPSAEMARTWTRTQVSPRAARPSCIRSASALAANTTGSASGSGGSNSWVTDRSSAGGRTASGREPRPRASRCAASPAAPNLLATSSAGSAARSPSVRRPSRFSRLARSGPAGSWSARTFAGCPARTFAGCRARTLTGCRARNSAVRPGGMTRTGRAARAARCAANSPSATPTQDSTPRSASAAVIRPASSASPPK
jgi:hypothetical protein